jgi:hypothetical protein
MTQDDIKNDPITVCRASNGSASEPNTAEVDTVTIELRIDAAKWAAAVASPADSAALVAFIEAVRV